MEGTVAEKSTKDVDRLFYGSDLLNILLRLETKVTPQDLKNI